MDAMSSMIENKPLWIDDANVNDFATIQRIYAPYVEQSSVSMEEAIPSVEDMRTRWQDAVAKSMPYLVAKKGGVIVGYAYATPYRTRSGYRFTVEESVYVANGQHGMGIGRLLLENLITRCREKRFKQMMAVIAGTGNNASIRLHKSLGFTHAGLLKQVGFKCGVWVDTLVMQKAL
jgi:phosphinothricin acetyltransferase